ncbi:MAG: CoA transferase [Gammaproteobacteria bacterium]|nr:CoA transferase [Gammaproteobacteria bacterium]
MEKQEFYAQAIADSVGPLEGIRVLEATNYASGPICGMIFSDLGALSVKCEMPGKGDPNRQVPPLIAGGDDLDASTIFDGYNRGKKSITLDFRKPEGQALFRQLAARSDVVIENFTPGTMSAWKLGYEHLSKENPGLVYVSISGFGQFGPLQKKKAFDPVGQAMGGFMSVTGEKGGRPLRTGPVLADDMSGWQAAIGALAALQYRNKTGQGQHVDASMTDAMIYATDMGIMGTANADFDWQRSGNTLGAGAPIDTYLCKDGQWVFIFAPFDAHWVRLCETMGLKGWADDPRLASYQARIENVAAVDEVINQWISKLTVDEAMALLDAAEVVAAPILTFEEIIKHPHYRERESVVELEHPKYGSLTHFGVATKFSRTPARLRHTAPSLGQDNEEIYQLELGLSDSEMDEMRAQKII